MKLMVLSCFIICVSCDRFTVNKEEVIARVGTVYLYRTDLEKETVDEVLSILSSEFED